MPCQDWPPDNHQTIVYERGSYYEEEYGRLLFLLKEVKTSTPIASKDYKRAFVRGKGKTDVDKLTDELCSLCQNLDVTKYSLELQLWWRDHQEADRLRKEHEEYLAKIKREQEEEEKELIRLRAIALSKLTEQDKKALGLDVFIK